MSSAWKNLRNDKFITELPHYAINQSCPEDNFFTDKKIAHSCFLQFQKICVQNKIQLDDYFFIEPSAGDGCFYDILPQAKIGIDINPKRYEFIQADFLQWYPNKKNKYIVIGNPPFGVRGALALAFIKRSLLFADIVAFILPMSFYSNGKGSNMKRVKNASLLYSAKLENSAFYTSPLKQTKVNTIFQIWKKGQTKPIFSNYDVSEFVNIYTVCSAPSRFCGLGRGRKYDCFIASTFYSDIKIVKNFAEVKYGSGYGIIIKKCHKKIMELLENTNWQNYCSDATNHCKHIRMHYIKKVLFQNGVGKKNET